MLVITLKDVFLTNDAPEIFVSMSKLFNIYAHAMCGYCLCAFDYMLTRVSFAWMCAA